jgi:hypothetical protein
LVAFKAVFSVAIHAALAKHVVVVALSANAVQACPTIVTVIRANACAVLMQAQVLFTLQTHLSVALFAIVVVAVAALCA